MIKIYSVRFNQYTNIAENTVSDYDEIKDIGSVKYLDVGNGTFLIKEKDINKVMMYGKGINTLKLVGYLKEFDEVNN